jgi:hypothetical protein
MCVVREDTALDKARQQQAEALKKYKQEVEKLTAQTESDRSLLQVGRHAARVTSEAELRIVT